MRVLAILLACLLTLAAGCTSSPPPADPPSQAATEAEWTTAGDVHATDEGTAPPAADVRFEQDLDLTVTFAAVAGLATNANQPNCVRFAPVTMANATATVTWEATATTQALQLVAANEHGYMSGSRRIEGTSPLTLEFAFPLGDEDLRIGVQAPTSGVAPATGVAPAIPVHITIAFQHPAGESPAPETGPCLI